MAVATLGLPSCDSKVSSTLDPALVAQIQLIEDCFPNLWPFAEGVFDIAKLWQRQDTNNPNDPTGLSHSFTGTGQEDITATLTVNGATLTMVISAYDPDGNKQNCKTLSDAGPISPATQLSEIIDNIATELRDLFTSGKPFLHGVWSITGGGISATGEGLLGIIGGATNDNELEEVRTTVATVTAPNGFPAVDPSTITDTGSTPNCTFTFRTDGLITDEDPDQEYPRGVISITIDDGTTDVDVTITFDKSAVAVIRIVGNPGSFEFNLETLALSTGF